MISDDRENPDGCGSSTRERIVTWTFLFVMYAIILSCPATIVWQIVKWLCRD